MQILQLQHGNMSYVDHTDKEYVSHERSRSWTVVGINDIDHTDHTDHLSGVCILVVLLSSSTCSAILPTAVRQLVDKRGVSSLSSEKLAFIFS